MGLVKHLGQSVWWVPSYQYRRRDNDQMESRGASYVVQKIGRKWASIGRGDGWRFIEICKETGSGKPDAHQGLSAGQAYESQEAYLQSERLRTAWNAFSRRITRMTPPNITRERLVEIAAALGVDIKDDQK